jgi:hypothetical protein
MIDLLKNEIDTIKQQNQNISKMKNQILWKKKSLETRIKDGILCCVEKEKSIEQFQKLMQEKDQ